MTLQASPLTLLVLGFIYVYFSSCPVLSYPKPQGAGGLAVFLQSGSAGGVFPPSTTQNQHFRLNKSESSRKAVFFTVGISIQIVDWTGLYLDYKCI